MSMIELAHNSCYADDKRNARYRDYDLDIDSRQLVRNLMKDMCGEDLSDLSDEEFDEYMGSVLSIELDSEVGLFALFYRNLWAMANLRETLKKYEDLEEQGRLVKLPCKVGDMLYYPEKLFDIVVPVRLNEIIISFWVLIHIHISIIVVVLTNAEMFMKNMILTQTTLEKVYSSQKQKPKQNWKN